MSARLRVCLCLLGWACVRLSACASQVTWAVDVHVDGLVVALRLQEQQLGDHQAGDSVIDLRRRTDEGAAAGFAEPGLKKQWYV